MILPYNLVGAENVKQKHSEGKVQSGVNANEISE